MVSAVTNEGTRAPVTRDRALRVAVALADGGGIESLSMRKLARELGIEAMSLYYHVKSKDEILDGMVDLVVGEMVLARRDVGWKTAVRERAESARTVLARHPWAISMMDKRNTRASMRFHDEMIGCLVGSGFSIPLAAHALSLVDSYVHGFALQEASLPLDESGDIGAATEGIMEQRDMTEFPHLTRMAVEHILQPGYAYAHEFEFGIRLILDGLDAALTSVGPP